MENLKVTDANDVCKSVFLLNNNDLKFSYSPKTQFKAADLDKSLDISLTDINKNIECLKSEMDGENKCNILDFVDDNKEDKNEINSLLTNINDTAENSTNVSGEQTKEILSILRPSRFYSSQNIIINNKIGKENVSINRPKPKYSKFNSNRQILPVRAINPIYKVLDEKGDIVLKNF